MYRWRAVLFGKPIGVVLWYMYFFFTRGLLVHPYFDGCQSLGPETPRCWWSHGCTSLGWERDKGKLEGLRHGMYCPEPLLVRRRGRVGGCSDNPPESRCSHRGWAEKSRSLGNHGSRKIKNSLGNRSGSVHAQTSLGHRLEKLPSSNFDVWKLWCVASILGTRKRLFFSCQLPSL